AELPKTARLALNDIGGIAFFSRRDVIDLMGLVTPEIIPYRRRGETGVIEYVSETCPDYVIIFPAWFPRLAASRETLEPIYRVRLARNEVAGAEEMVVYRLVRCGGWSGPCGAWPCCSGPFLSWCRAPRPSARRSIAGAR